MTVKIVGHWELSWRTPIEEFDSWIHPLREFGHESFYMCPVSGIGIAKQRVLERASIDDVFEENPDLTRVFIDEGATDSLVNFIHPTDAIYVIGKTSYSPYITHFREGIDQCVKIPTVTNGGGFWGDHAITMILYDRFSKGQ
tara:strand:+ start:5924 stop:6349 length:426 start_codon:yes stop_codon:yes gene_type:complete